MTENSSRDNPALHDTDEQHISEMAARVWPRSPLDVINILHKESDALFAHVLNRLMVIVLLFSSACFGADIHQWRDKEGAVHFGDRPPLDTQSERLTLKPNVYEGTYVENLSTYPEKNAEVILYSTARCGYCRKARNYFQSNDIAFTEYDVEKSTRGKRDFKRLGAQGVPVILVGKKKLFGFSESSFEKAYRAR